MAPDEAETAAFTPDGPRQKKKKKSAGHRLSVRLGRRDDDEMWPDDGVSDEDYWASVSAEHPLPTTEPGKDLARIPRNRRGMPPAGPPPSAPPPGAWPGEQRPGGDARPGGDQRQAPRPGSARPTTGIAISAAARGPGDLGARGPGDAVGTGQRGRPTGPSMRPGNGVSGNGASGNGVSGNGASGNGTSGYVTFGNGAPGNGTPGYGTPSYGTPGNGTSSNGTSSNGNGNGNGASGNGTSGYGDRTPSARPAAEPRDGSRQRGRYEPAPYLESQRPGPPNGGGSRREIPPDRYQAALTESTQAFSLPASDSESPRPRSDGGGRHSRGPAEDRTRSYPYPEPAGEDPYNQGYGNGRR
jgi:hypothetical protein